TDVFTAAGCDSEIVKAILVLPVIGSITDVSATETVGPDGVVVVVVVDPVVVVVDELVLVVVVELPVVVVDDVGGVPEPTGAGVNVAVRSIVALGGPSGSGAPLLIRLTPGHVAFGSGDAGIVKLLSTISATPVPELYGVPCVLPVFPVVRLRSSGP